LSVLSVSGDTAPAGGYLLRVYTPAASASTEVIFTCSDTRAVLG
jgi:hypothetical protein